MHYTQKKDEKNNYRCHTRVWQKLSAGDIPYTPLYYTHSILILLYYSIPYPSHYRIRTLEGPRHKQDYFHFLSGKYKNDEYTKCS